MTKQERVTLTSNTLVPIGVAFAAIVLMVGVAYSVGGERQVVMGSIVDHEQRLIKVENSTLTMTRTVQRIEHKLDSFVDQSRMTMERHVDSDGHPPLRDRVLRLEANQDKRWLAE